MDGLCLYASSWEMQSLVGGKIDKITQPEKDELILTIRSGGKNIKCLFSASASHCGVYLTEQKRNNPIDAPMFCMLLRKRIGGGRILSVEQPELDRVLRVSIQCCNEMGDELVYTLIAEIMGKHSNIILVDENGTVIDAIKRVGLGVSVVRTVLPGQAYQEPPKQTKHDPRLAKKEDFLQVLSAPGRADKLLSNAFFGLAPIVAAAMLQSAAVPVDAQMMSAEERDRAANWLYSFYQQIAKGQFSVYMSCNEYGDPLAIYPFRPDGAYVQSADSIGQAMDLYFEKHEMQNYLSQKSAVLRHTLQNNIERCEKKLSLYAQAIDSDEKMEQDRLYGELLTANLHLLKKSAAEAAVINYYADPPAPLVIPMDKQFSPGENAQRYYKRYQKAKIARDFALRQRGETMEELSYLEGQLDNLGKCTKANELSEIIKELHEQGYGKSESKKGKQQKLPESKPFHFISSDGTDILVGKNNRQNDTLTLHTAQGDDLWLHTKDIPGSHVIVRSASPSMETLKEAACLAAYYSKARGGENVPVDYTQRKNVKKPGGAKPGMVIYVKNRTAYVTPEESIVKNLRRAEE